MVLALAFNSISLRPQQINFMDDGFAASILRSIFVGGGAPFFFFFLNFVAPFLFGDTIFFSRQKIMCPVRGRPYVPKVR